MRPTIGDIINGTKRIIQEVVFPFVAEHPNHPEQPAVMENLLSLMVLLEHAAQRWDKAHLFLAEENRELTALLSKISNNPPQPSALGVDLSAMWEINSKVKERIATLLQALPAALRSEAEKSLAQLVEREKEWIKVGEVLWD
ncbi:MAG: hypothetical protein HYT87_14405 [Nitrospirae bacterium]|nr:hypothetical protein [Nitrospirota bacterium]